MIMVAASCAAASSAAEQGKIADLLGAENAWEVAVEGLGFADGLSYDAEGNVYFADLRGGNAGVYRLSPDGTKTKLTSGGRSGTRPGPDGKLYACGGKTLVAIDVKDGKLTTVADNLGTNDLAVSKSGYAYITGKQVTAVNLKTGEARAADTGITSPNGIGLTTGGTLYVSDYGGLNVFAFKVNEDGTLSDKKPVMTLKAPPDKPTVAGGDGMTLDVEGRCYVTSALGLQVFNSAGKLIGILPKPGNGPLVSAGFGGKGLSTLYVACGDKIYKRPTMTRGMPPVR
jgi:enterochelin esterase family protein